MWKLKFIDVIQMIVNSADVCVSDNCLMDK